MTNMASPGSFNELRALAADDRPSARAETVRDSAPRAENVQGYTTRLQHLHGDVYLFIYRIRHSYDAYSWVDNIRYCTVFALGKHFADAERIAINCVHQHGWRILKTDTATAFALDRFTDGGTDAAHVANLWDFGVSFKLNH
jgi:hypothetical protein